MQRVLVVDDNAELRSLLADLLCLEGFAVREAADGQSALDVFVNCSPDAVLLDIQMPRMDGLEALESIRNRRADVPVLILTGISDPYVEKEALQRGASGYFQKFPLDLERVLFSLREALAGNRSEGTADSQTMSR